MSALARRHFAIGFMRGTQQVIGIVDIAIVLYALNHERYKLCFIVFGCTTVLAVVAQVMKKNLERGK